MATIRNRGVVRKERISSKAFSFTIDQFRELQAELEQLAKEPIINALRIEQIRQELERRNVHILSGHDFATPLGSLLTGAAILSNDDGVSFEVDLPEEAKQPSWMRDAVLGVEAGLINGVSPGFSIPPKNVVPGAETFEEEEGNTSVQVRVVNQAILYELSLVTRPAYSETEVNVRAEDAERGYMRNFRVWL